MKSENDQDTGKGNCTNLIQPSTNATSRMQRVLVVIDSLLRGTEAPISDLDNLSNKIC